MKSDARERDHVGRHSHAFAALAFVGELHRFLERCLRDGQCGHSGQETGLLGSLHRVGECQHAKRGREIGVGRAHRRRCLIQRVTPCQRERGHERRVVSARQRRVQRGERAVRAIELDLVLRDRHMSVLRGGVEQNQLPGGVHRLGDLAAGVQFRGVEDNSSTLRGKSTSPRGNGGIRLGFDVLRVQRVHLRVVGERVDTVGERFDSLNRQVRRVVREARGGSRRANRGG